jgi:hypothetical protein
MTSKVEGLKEFAEYSFKSVNNAWEGITEKEASWKPIVESNNIKWIMNHLSRISNVALPRLIKGDENWLPKGWPENYREMDLSIERLKEDFNKGKERTITLLGELKDSDLVKEIPLWGGTRKRQEGLFAYIGELVNHKGQIAMLRGNIKRIREKSKEFLK